MKRFSISILALGAFIYSFAQGEPDMLRISQNDLKGTAHSMGMGGAVGALGSDATAITINPAGIGVYKSSEITATMNFSNVETKTNLNAGEVSDKKFKFNFDNLSYVGAFPIMSKEVPFINFGFAYNRLKSFDRRVSSKGNNLNYSMTDYIANISNGDNYTTAELDNSGNYNPFRTPGIAWLPILGYNSGLIDKYNDGWGATLDGNVNNSSYLQEKGYISSYDFSLGTTISDIVSLGLTFSLTDVDYHLYSDYSEDFANDYFILENFLKTEGSGYQVKAGVILKPINELRIGVSYHSPTWYKMTDWSSAIMTSGGQNLGQRFVLDTYDESNAGNTYFDYELRTPDKWTFSLAGIIAKRAIISADYELTNYKNMHLEDSYGTPDREMNDKVSNDFRTSSTLRVGAEILFTPQFSGRVGYSWVQTPFSKDITDLGTNASGEQEYPNLWTAGTTTQFMIDGDTNYFTWGLGYYFTKNFYSDIAFVIRNQKSDYYHYTAADPVELKTNAFSGVLTFGYRF